MNGRLAIIGLGALGSLFAARLAPEVEVTMLGHWPEQLAAIRERGLNLITPEGEQTRRQVHVTDRPPGWRFPLILVLVKSWQTATAAGAAGQMLASDGLALSLQNGLGNLEQLARTLGAGRAGLGVTSEGAMIPEPGVVLHAGRGLTSLARSPTRAGQVEEAAALLRAAGFETEIVDDAQGLLWGKLAVNTAINPLSALLQVPNGHLIQSPAAARILAAA
ncbi:MAG: ketopantoate reductase family protein, partial [Candidatus Promineifilaceae bacterium]